MTASVDEKSAGGMFDGDAVVAERRVVSAGAGAWDPEKVMPWSLVATAASAATHNC